MLPATSNQQNNSTESDDLISQSIPYASPAPPVHPNAERIPFNKNKICKICPDNQIHVHAKSHDLHKIYSTSNPSPSLQFETRFDKRDDANKKPYHFNINHFRSISISFCFLYLGDDFRPSNSSQHKKREDILFLSVILFIRFMHVARAGGPQTGWPPTQRFGG